MSKSLLAALLSWLRGLKPKLYQPPSTQLDYSVPVSPRPASNAPQIQRRSLYGTLDRLSSISKGDEVIQRNM